MLIFATALGGCADEETAPEARAEAPRIETKATPFVGTWRWASSGGRIGTTELGEEHFIFRENGTYAVISKSAYGWSECYEGTFTWSKAADEGGSAYGMIVFKSSHLRDKVNGFARDVHLDGADTLRFNDAGTYVRTGPALGAVCP